MPNIQAADFQIDHQQRYVEQIEAYLNSIGSNLDANELPLQQSKQLVHLFIKTLDFGAHSSNSDRHLESSYSRLAKHILIKTQMLQLMSNERAAMSVEDDNLRVLKMFFGRQFQTCAFCGAEFMLKYNQGHLSLLDEPLEMRFSTYTPPSKTECFKVEQRSISLTTKSDQMVFANDLRPFLKDQSIDFVGEEINTPYGRIKAVQDFASKGVFCVSAGNCSMQLLKNQDDLIITNGYITDIEAYDYDDDSMNQVRNINAVVKQGRYKQAQTISCGLWWLMGASVDDVDMDSLIAAYPQDHLIINVEKGAEYRIEFNTQPQRFKFYKFVKNK